MLLLFFNDLRNRDSTNPSEGSQRDIFKNMLKYSERVGRGNEQQGERERDEKRTNTDRILHVCTSDSIFRCHPLFIGRRGCVKYSQ